MNGTVRNFRQIIEQAYAGAARRTVAEATAPPPPADGMLET
jgi:hypothetical protein